MFKIRWPHWLKNWRLTLNTKVMLPILKYGVAFLNTRIERRLPPEQSGSEWKKRALSDFKTWLSEIQDAHDEGGMPLPEACDLYTLLSEFSVLRQEIKVQNREQHKATTTLDEVTHVIEDTQQTLMQTFRDSQADFIRALQDMGKDFEIRTSALADLEENIRKDCEKRIVRPFFDIRDALVRGLHSSRGIATAKKSFLRGVPKGLEGISEGYEMALRRLDRAMEMLDIHYILTVGQPFDPKTMKAIAQKSQPNIEKGVVIEELLSGYRQKDVILRTSEVIVNG